MKTEDFVSTDDLRAQIVYRKLNTTNNKVNWLMIQWLQLKKDTPYQIWYKYSHNSLEAWEVLDVKRHTRGCPSDMGRTSLPPLYSGPRQIQEKKLNDIIKC